MRRRNPRTVLELCVARGGPVKGARVCAFIAQWAMTTQALGRPIDMTDYREWWRESNGAAYRERARFRELFPELDTPQPIADLAVARVDEWLERGVGGFSMLPADVALVA